MGSFSVFEDVLLQMREQEGHPQTGALATGFPEWDARTGGMPLGAVTVLAGPPAIGTSALAQRLVLNVLLNGEAGVLIACPSDGPAMFTKRAIVATTNPPDKRLPPMYRYYPPGRDDWLHSPAAWFVDGLGLSLNDITHAVRDMAASAADIRLLVVDSLHDVAGVDLRPSHGCRVIEALKELARELGIAVLICARLPPRRYEVDARTHRPRLSELRAYGPVVGHVELVALLHREPYFDGGAINAIDAELLGFSQTFGQFWLPLVWDPSRATFACL